MTITSMKNEINLRDEYVVTHSANEMYNKSREWGILGRPVCSPEAIPEWQWYALLCQFLVHP
jgi:hypothetical protein